MNDVVNVFQILEYSEGNTSDELGCIFAIVSPEIPKVSK
jgi:hypothetical protein